MSLWFVYSLISALFAGLHTFALKISVEKKYDTYLLSTLSSVVSFIVGAIYLAIFDLWSTVPAHIYWFAALGGVFFTVFSLARMEGLKFIDSAIFFPLYKVVGPAIVAGLGIAVLKDQVSTAELIGIILSCLVPLLLISRTENTRQKNLQLGLLFMLISTVVSSVSSVVNSWVVGDIAAYALPLAIIGNGFTAIFSAILYSRKHPPGELYHQARPHLTKGFLGMSLANGVFQILSSGFLFLAFAYGEVSIVYSVTAHYILIPVLLSVWIYKEHWNLQKACALGISILALILLH